MDVSITNRLPRTILAVEPQALPYVRVVLNLGVTQLDALVTTESVEGLGSSGAPRLGDDQDRRDRERRGRG